LGGGAGFLRRAEREPSRSILLAEDKAEAEG